MMSGVLLPLTLPEQCLRQVKEQVNNYRAQHTSWSVPMYAAACVLHMFQ
jgi:hypothetical protein